MSQNDKRYEPPALTKVGKFTELTLGIPVTPRYHDFVGYWAV